MNRNYRLFSVFFMLFVLLASGSVSSAQDRESSLKLNTVVIDPGHGGKDPGCVSRDRKTYEKNLTLAIAKLFGQKIKDAYPDVRVIYTRLTDKYLTLNERADIANRNNAGLFISLHINSFDGSSSPNGFSAHILGQSSRKNTDLFSNQLDVCKRENSVILLEEDYSTKYQGFNPNDPESFIFFNLMQSAFYEQSLQFAAEFDKAMTGGPIRTSRGISQDPFYVLWKTTMPAVLVETGFMSNANDLKVLNSASGKEQIANRLFLAFKEFKRQYDGSVDYQSGSPAASKAQAGASGTVYGVQIMASGKKLAAGHSAFKGYEATAYPSGNIYKYVVGGMSSVSEARALHGQIKKKFPDSFIVKIADGKVTRP